MYISMIIIIEVYISMTIIIEMYVRMIIRWIFECVPTTCLQFERVLLFFVICRSAVSVPFVRSLRGNATSALHVLLNA